MRKPPQGGWRSVDRGTRRPGIELRNQVVWDADAVNALPYPRHFGKALPWPYAGPRALSSDLATYVNAVACTSRARGQPCTYGKTVVRCMENPAWSMPQEASNSSITWMPSSGLFSRGSSEPRYFLGMTSEVCPGGIHTRIMLLLPPFGL